VIVSATTTYSLSCTGAGGTASQTVKVTATAAQSSGGGGAIDFASILALLSLCAVACSRRFAASLPLAPSP
jgi:hypothetical protein